MLKHLSTGEFGSQNRCRNAPRPPPTDVRVCVCFRKLALIKQPFGALLLSNVPKLHSSDCSAAGAAPQNNRHVNRQRPPSRRVAMATRAVLSNENEAAREVGQKQFL